MTLCTARRISPSTSRTRACSVSTDPAGRASSRCPVTPTLSTNGRGGGEDAIVDEFNSVFPALNPLTHLNRGGGRIQVALLCRQGANAYMQVMSSIRPWRDIDL